MLPFPEIKSIQFGFLSDADIENISVCEINKTTLLSQEEGGVYDLRLGCLDKKSLCKTCEQDIFTCTGHFGHINLNIPIILFHKVVVKFLKIFCFNCFRLLCAKKFLDLNEIKGNVETKINFISKINFCFHCKNIQPQISFDSNENIIKVIFKENKKNIEKILQPENIQLIFGNIKIEDLSVLKIDPEMFHPKNLILTKILVIPTCCRPRMVGPENINDDDLTLLLNDIIKINKILEEKQDDKTKNLLRTKILTYKDNSKGKAIYRTNNKKIIGIAERISTKTGQLRQNVFGKRINKSGRTVMGPDPTLKMNEIGIPKKIANTLTITEWCTPYSIKNLTELVNSKPEQFSIIEKKNGNKLSVSVLTKQKFLIHHGDRILRDGKEFIVTDCKIPIYPTDKIFSFEDGKEKIFEQKPLQKISLELGDKIERFMKDGDYTFLNRQPTLHRNNMQGMKMKIFEGKTQRVNLGIVSGFNMDFDGDEGNIFPETNFQTRSELMFLVNAKENIISSKNNQPEIFIVQDSLLGAYKMTEKYFPMEKEDFFKCLMSINYSYNTFDRLKEILNIRYHETKISPKIFLAHDLFGFIFPRDFSINHSGEGKIVIKNGVVVSGFFEKSSLKKTHQSLILILHHEYGKHITSDFIDNLQFLTNAWLEINPFSIGIKDCLSPGIEIKINSIIEKYFIEADHLERIILNPLIKESKINTALNKAKDIGLKIAKELLDEKNNFTSCVISGSKGDHFNIAQITGLLGQQNLNGQRPKLIDKNRCLIHFPPNINETNLKYKSRGFIQSSFIQGMNPIEMFFHSLSGRTGVIETSLGTATSGYLQRSLSKLFEDIKIHYDGTVRDARGNIYQFRYGNHGFDPREVVFYKEKIYPINIINLAKRMEFEVDDKKNMRKLNDSEINSIIDKCSFRSNIPEIIYSSLVQNEQQLLREQLLQIKIHSSLVDKFSKIIIDKYHLSRITPGECVGIIAAQSIGEQQTQCKLNTFHTAGKFQETEIDELENLLNISKNMKSTYAILYFKKKYVSIEELKKDIGSSLVGLKFENLYTDYKIFKKNIYFQLNLDLLYEYRLDPIFIFEKINTIFDNEIESCEVGISSLNFFFYSKKNPKIFDKVLICGIPEIKNLNYYFENDEWIAITNGVNLKKLFIHPLIDPKKILTNDIWEVFSVLGIIQVKKMLYSFFKKLLNNINECHIKLLVDKMTFLGFPTPITRYSMRTNAVGPLSKSSYEESIDIITSASINTETDFLKGISAQIFCGNIPKIGSGMMDIVIDHEKIIEND